MSVYCSIFNGKPMKYLFDKSDRKKIALSPSLAKKLLVSPSVFQSSACIAKIKKAHELLSITTADLIFFPVIVQRHWVLICVNLLYKTINFFDSVKITSDHDVVRMIQNLATNFTTACFEANISTQGFKHFKPYSSLSYPCEAVVLLWQSTGK
ncbi:uncharacterized protein LOC120710740 [Panicum virgatum]|uniref:uncharacterized protein LOC120710740 n=1 Tax=Panicum virgatum TaxID=38727 RepID=UPI0019D68A54|nr:uncharacterized protein LOC120710740 [Panicum virgatum]